MKQKKNIAGKEGQPFKVPEGYFESMQASVMEKIRAERRSEDQASEQVPGGLDKGSSLDKDSSLDKESSREERSSRRSGAGKRIRLMPYLSLAAAITGFALISFVVVQSILGSRLNDPAYYDLSMLDETGVLNDENAILQSYTDVETQESDYNEWEEDALLYLASNDAAAFEVFESN